jgi:hypothetical protein
MIGNAHYVTLPGDTTKATSVTRRFASDVPVEAEANGEG